MQTTSGSRLIFVWSTLLPLATLVILGLISLLTTWPVSSNNYMTMILAVGLSVMLYFLRKHGESLALLASILQSLGKVDPKDFGSLAERITEIERYLEEPSDQGTDHSLRDYRQ